MERGTKGMPARLARAYLLQVSATPPIALEVRPWQLHPQLSFPSSWLRLSYLTDSWRSRAEKGGSGGKGERRQSRIMEGEMRGDGAHLALHNVVCRAVVPPLWQKVAQFHELLAHLQGRRRRLGVRGRRGETGGGGEALRTESAQRIGVDESADVFSR